MKELFIIRHAKSSWDYAHLSDFERPLNKRGMRDAPFMGTVLKGHQFMPDLILSSPANRAISTARIIKDKLGFEGNIVEEKAIYEASAFELLKIINSIDDQFNRVFVFGHNPGFTYLAEKLSDRYFGNIPTCGIAGIRFEFESWSLVSAGTGSNFYYDYPKNHR